jgi:transcriptional regulator with XRE-family HTH domain
MASMTSLREDLGEYLKEQRHHAKLTLRQLADVAGVSNPYLSQIERGLKRPSAEILQSLASGLRISAESLYVRAGLLDEHDPDHLPVRAALLGDPALTDRQKRVLLDIYASFRTENERADAAADVPAASGPAPDLPPTAAPTTTARPRPAKKTAPGKTAPRPTAPRKTAARTTAARTTAPRTTAPRTTATKRSTTTKATTPSSRSTTARSTR